MDQKTVINNHMDSEISEVKTTQSTPNESTGIYVRGFVKITDPESGEVLLETAN